jgi:hypothetical protein
VRKIIDHGSTSFKKSGKSGSLVLFNVAGVYLQNIHPFMNRRIHNIISIIKQIIIVVVIIISSINGGGV